MVDISDMAGAATLAISDALPFLIGNKNDPREIEWAIEPVNGFVWSKDLVSAVKGRIINDFICCVMGGGLS